nr:MAG TPA: hypothetical protein [Caudoviricetes sp.]
MCAVCSDEIIKTKSTSMTAVAIKEVPFAWRDI